jgi:hypothetical protein
MASQTVGASLLGRETSLTYLVKASVIVKIYVCLVRGHKAVQKDLHGSVDLVQLAAATVRGVPEPDGDHFGRFDICDRSSSAH